MWWIVVTVVMLWCEIDTDEGDEKCLGFNMYEEEAAAL